MAPTASNGNVVSIKPLITWPRQVIAGRSYLLTIDLRPVHDAEWPYAEEEYVIYCRFRHGKTLQIDEIGEPCVVLHRFGGSYGPTAFRLKPLVSEGVDNLVLEMYSGWGLPIGEINLGQINIVKGSPTRLFGPSQVDKDQDINVVLTAQASTADVIDEIQPGEQLDSITHITKIYLQGPGKAQLEEQKFRAALGRYLHWVEKRYGRLDLRGVEPREQNPLSLTLDDIYVSLSALVTPKREERFRARTGEMQEQEVKSVDMSGLLALGPRLIITGVPGSGKTTFLRLIAATVARAIRLGETELAHESLGLAEPLMLPIFISLSDFNRYRRKFGESADPLQGLMAFISHDLIHKQAVRGLPADFFERLLNGGQGVMLLLDGLDEVADERERVLVSRAVEHLAFNDGVGRVIVTSRTRAYYGDAALAEEFRLATVRPMTPEQVDLLADRWCHAVYLEETVAATESRRLREAIRNLEARRAARGEPPLADNPLIVTIIANLHYNERRLPEQRAELYGKFVDVLLAEKHHQQVTEAHYELVDWGGKLADKRKWLAYLAFRMMDAGAEAGRAVDEQTLGDWLRPRLATSVGEDEVERQLQAFCTAMRERGSLLTERGGLYQFTHLTFQQYLGATYLADVVTDTGRLAAYFVENGRLADAWWRETALLVAGYLGLRSDEQALQLLQRLAMTKPDNSTALAAAELAGSAYLELDIQDTAIKNVIVSRLVVLVTDPEVEATPQLRLLAGDALGRLGDPRPGVTTLEPELVSISTGPFQMGDDRYTVVIEHPFAIARYPVTNAQFRLFVEDGGYTDRWRACWTEEGWRYKKLNKWLEPIYMNDPRLNGPNQPVVGTSWYEAMAYAAWLRITTGRPYRLPTDAEWERAARHYDGRQYPWGNEWQTGITNSKESELQRPTAVGIFPRSNAHSGACDLAGNVWEWCQTRWLNEKGLIFEAPYEANDGREEAWGDSSVSRSMRGGSWSDEGLQLRCANRIESFPDYRDDIYGFRLVVSPVQWQSDEIIQTSATRYQSGHNDPLRHYQVDQRCEGKVVGFGKDGIGAFIELEPGVEGFLYKDEITLERINDAREHLQEGQQVKIRILEIDYNKREMRFTIRGLYERSLLVPTSHAYMVIGRFGKEIKGIMQDTQTYIDLADDGVCTVQGLQQQLVDAAVRRIEAIVARRIVTINLDDRQKRMLIGKGGSTIRKIQSRTGARILSERDSSQVSVIAENDVILHNVLAEIQETVTYAEATILIPPSRIGRVVGKGGSIIQDIKTQTGTRIDISKDNSGRVHIEGSSDYNVGRAIEMIRSRAGSATVIESKQGVLPEYKEVR